MLSGGRNQLLLWGNPEGAQPETRIASKKDFSIWIRCNPLKSPESAKGIQETPSLFPWFY
jgi:hypothetical protein